MRLIEGASKTKSGSLLHHFIPTKEEAGNGARDVHSAWMVKDGETCVNDQGEPCGSLMPVSWLAMLDWDETTVGDAALKIAKSEDGAVVKAADEESEDVS